MKQVKKMGNKLEDIEGEQFSNNVTLKVLEELLATKANDEEMKKMEKDL